MSRLSDIFFNQVIPPLGDSRNARGKRYFSLTVRSVFGPDLTGTYDEEKVYVLTARFSLKNSRGVVIKRGTFQFIIPNLGLYIPTGSIQIQQITISILT